MGTPTMERRRTEDPLVAFLYLLLRDHLPAGRVEKVVMDVETMVPHEGFVLTNGFQAQYAEALAARLQKK